ncbi:MAG: 50S ribosomal protein L9 [Proteobacteria bacterium]|nr:50S ribosomal protein L9 [Pseudomonadota bacterium]
MPHTQVILTEGQQGVGKLGEVVRVKSGYARNYLLPRGKALVATKANLEKFEAQKAEFEATQSKAKAEAEKLAAKHKEFKLELTRNASETGQLYGSIKAKDLAVDISAAGLQVAASQVIIGEAIKVVGEHTVRVALHPEVIITVPVTVSRQSLA